MNFSRLPLDRQDGCSQPCSHAYGPFGEPIRATGPQAANPFRFSTKCCDAESGLYYYDPVTGRWLSRDPIGEDKEVDPCAFIHNAPISYFDRVGLETVTDDIWVESNHQPRPIIGLEAVRKIGFELFAKYETTENLRNSGHNTRSLLDVYQFSDSF